MASTNYRAMAIIAEQIGIPPITLLDEIVNAINQIMKKATLGLEAYLKRQRLAYLNQFQNEGDQQGNNKKQLEEAQRVFNLEAIEQGAVLFDTLCHSQLDQNLDKFEMYLMRNVFKIPDRLVDEGWMLLKHQEYMRSAKLPKLAVKEADKQLQTLVKNINKELQLRKILKVQIAKSKAIITSLKLYKDCVDGLLLTHANTQLTPEAVRVLGEKLDPMNESVFYLLTQVNELVHQVLLLSSKVAAPEAQTLLNGNSSVSSRDAYIEEKTRILLEKIGLFQERRQSRRSARGL